MGEDAGKDREELQGGQPIPSFRSADAKAVRRNLLGVPILAVCAALFIAYGVSIRDYTKSLGDNLQYLARQCDDRIQELGERVRDLEKWAWKRGKR